MSAQLDFNLNNEQTPLCSSCCTCHAAIAQESVYCRWCGVQQPELSLSSEPTNGLKNYIGIVNKPSAYLTTQLENATGNFADSANSKEQSLRISGYLIHSFVESVKSTSSHFQGGFEKAALALLTFIPVCLLIIFLSPLDAYFATKSFLKG